MSRPSRVTYVEHPPRRDGDSFSMAALGFPAGPTRR